MSSRTRGFTLIELLLVIAIIALLSSIALASLQYVRSQARDARRALDIRNYITALQLMYTTEGRYFADNSDYGVSSNLAEFSSYLISHGYLPAPIQDPINIIDAQWGIQTYGYSSFNVPGGACGQYYELWYHVETGSHVIGSDCSILNTKGKWSEARKCVMYGPEPPPCGSIVLYQGVNPACPGADAPTDSPINCP